MSDHLRNPEVLLFFLMPDFPLWNELYGVGFQRDEFYKDIVRAPTYSKWAGGQTIGEKKPREILEATIKKIETSKLIDQVRRQQLIVQVRKFAVSYETDPRFDERAAAKLFGISPSAAQTATYKRYYKRLPGFPHMMYDSADRSRKDRGLKDFNSYSGVWEAWIKRTYPNGQFIWLLAALHVQELARLNKGLSIMCVLHFPIIDQVTHVELYEEPPDPWFTYRGFLAVRPDHLSFIFEFCPERSMGDQREDNFFILTKPKALAPDRVYEIGGKYMTMGQGLNREEVCDEMVMRRVVSRNIADTEECMRKVRVVTDATEIAYAESTFKRFKARQRSLVLSTA